MRIVFMGTPEFAVPSLLACLAVGEVVAVVTQPDKPKGRGQEMQPTPVKAAALERGLTVLQPPKIRTPPFSEELKNYAPDVCVVTAYGKILPRDLLDVPKLGCLNVHASLLPRWRGAAPIQWSVAEGDERSGVCLMRMEEGLDTGPVLSRREVALLPDETGQSLHDRLSALGGDVLREELPRFFRGELSETPQSEGGMTYAPMIKKEDGQLDFRRPAIVLERRLRAFTPWPGAYTRLGAALLKVHRAHAVDGSGPAGQVLSAGPDGIVVACATGALRIEELQLEGKKRVTAGEFLRGRAIETGSQPFVMDAPVEQTPKKGG